MITTELVTIKPAPPLSQSRIKLLACEHSYKAIEIDRMKPPPSGPSDRGEEVHEVHATYTNYCVNRQVSADWAAFDHIARSVGVEAYKILEGVRDNYQVDFEHVAGTEIWFCLNADFKPIRVPEESKEWSREEKQAWAVAHSVAYEGTIDLGLLLSETEGQIDDWKSHMRPFDAPDEQSDEYSLAWFQLNPQLQSVLFRFRFVRYAHCERIAEYTREDLPRLMATLEHYRAKQLAIHANPESAQAIPSKQCLYCPLLNNGCPIDPMVNPWVQGSAGDWIKRAVYLSYAGAQNNERLKEWVQASGQSVRYVDGIGNAYEFGPKETHSQEFPLLPTMEALLEHKNMTPGDTDWFANLRVSATKLKQYLKAKKRAPLHQFIMDTVATKVSRVQTGLHKPVDDRDNEEYFQGQ